MATRPKDDLRVTPPPRPNRGSNMADVNVDKLWESIDKITSTVNKSARHTERIPEIQRKVESTGEKVVQLDTKMDATTERVTKIEDKVDAGHICQIPDTIESLKTSTREASQKIDTDVQKGIETKGRLDAVVKDQSQTEADVQDIKRLLAGCSMGSSGSS